MQQGIIDARMRINYSRQCIHIRSHSVVDIYVGYDELTKKEFVLCEKCKIKLSRLSLFHFKSIVY